MDKKLDEYGLDELEKVCLNERLANEKYYKTISEELKKGLTGNSSFINTTLDSQNEILRVMSFNELEPKVLRSVCDDHGLKCISKSKTLNIDMNGPIYTYFFVSNKKTFVSNVLCSDLTKVDDDKVIFNLLDEKNDLK